MLFRSTRAFVRSYAVAVGLEPEQAIREFMTEFPQDSVTAGHPISRRFDDSGESDGRTSAMYLKVLAFSVPVAALIAYVVAGPPLFRRSASTPGAAVEQSESRTAPAAQVLPPPTDTPASTVPPAAEPTPAPSAPASTPPEPVSPKGTPSARDTFTVGVSARAPCWVSIVVDGVPSLQRLMAPGEQFTFHVRGEIVLRTGNAGALALTLNGNDAKPIGRPGEVVTRHVTSANFKDYLATP